MNINITDKERSSQSKKTNPSNTDCNNNSPNHQYIQDPYQPYIRLDQSLSLLSPHYKEFLKHVPFGSSMRFCFGLESDTIFLNHGSYGTSPTPVFAAHGFFMNRMEKCPDRFIRHELPSFLQRSRSELAKFLGADADDITFVTNATTGVNSVLRSIDLQDGDEVMCLSLTYPAVSNTLRYICYYTQELVELKEVKVTLPLRNYDDLFAQVDSVITQKTALAVFDHISSPTGLLLPVERLVDICHRKGVPVLIDGAHVPGQIPLNLVELNADYYVGNCYKWLFSSKSCAFLYVKKEFQSTVRPVVTSLGYEQGFVEDFAQQGTRDESSFLTIQTAIDFYTSLGEKRIFAHNTGLIDWATDYLSKLWGTESLLPKWQRCPFISAVRLPFQWIEEDESKDANYMQSICDCISQILYDQYRICALIVSIQRKLYVRLCSQVYNESKDYEKLGMAVKALNRQDNICAQLQQLTIFNSAN